MTKNLALIALAGTAMVACGALLGWAVTAAPSKTPREAVLIATAPAQPAPTAEREANRPAPPAAVPAPDQRADSPVVPPAVVQPSETEPKAEAAPTPPQIKIGRGQPGVFGIETPKGGISLNTNRGNIRFKTPFGEISLD